MRAKCRSDGFIKRSHRSIRFNCIAMGRTAVKLIAQRGVFVWRRCATFIIATRSKEQTDLMTPSLENDLADVTLARA